jgi:hypothetical protein
VFVRFPGSPITVPDVPCAFCDADTAEWVHQLDPAKAQFTEYGKGHVWASNVAFCERCEQLYRAGEDEELVHLQVGDWDGSAEAIDETIRKPLAVFREADQGPVRLDDLLPPGAAELRAAGFMPVEMLTGEFEIAGVWPWQHRRSLPETREDWVEDAVDGRFWLVRSPWPSVDVRDVVRLLWPWVEAREGRNPYRDQQQHLELVRQFLSLDEDSVRKMLSEPDQA